MAPPSSGPMTVMVLMVSAEIAFWGQELEMVVLRRTLEHDPSDNEAITRRLFETLGLNPDFVVLITMSNITL